MAARKLTRMLIYRILADATVVVHALMAAFAVLGLVAVLVGRVASGMAVDPQLLVCLIHLGLIVAIAVFPLIGGLCPLTELENWLRKQSGGETYPGSFIAHWVHELLFVQVSSQVIAVKLPSDGGLIGVFLILRERPRKEAPNVGRES